MNWKRARLWRARFTRFGPFRSLRGNRQAALAKFQTNALRGRNFPDPGYQVSHEILVQFVRFEAKGSVREYTFTVREPAADPREFKLTISNEAFDERRVRYQDAPDVCSVKLRQELATHGNHPPTTQYQITDAELEDYRSSHSPKIASKPSFYHKPAKRL